MKYLFIHPNFPGQFTHICKELAKDPKNEVLFISDPKPKKIPGVTQVFIKFKHKPNPNIHRYLRHYEEFIYRGQAIWRTCHELKTKQEFTPDIIYAHPGWGDALFLKDIFPNSKLITYAEFYYNAFGADVHFNPEEPINEDTIAKIRIKNSHLLASISASDLAISPTNWQKSQFPKEFHSKIKVIHDGLDTDWIKPENRKKLVLPNGKAIYKQNGIITYSVRNLEPYRGFEQFIEASKIILDENPKCEIVVVGGDDVSYGAPAPKGQTYRELFTKKHKLNETRINFLGYLPHTELHKVMSISTAHIYLTVPFVLSWSMLEAMAMECLIIGSKTPPVEELITHQKNGLLVDFFSPNAIAETALEVLKNPNDDETLRKTARETIKDNYALKSLLPKQLELIQSGIK